MSVLTYPTVITEDMLEAITKISDREILRDIVDTHAEIRAKKDVMVDILHDIRDRERFIAYLEAILEAREGDKTC